jgi:Na+/phosphate symporter
MVILGAHAGASVITYITGIHFRGQPRQLVTAQVLYNLVAVSVFLVLFVLDHVIGGRDALIPRLSHAITGTRGADAAVAALGMNAITSLLLTLARRPFHRLCLQLAPMLQEEGLARPQFLRAEVADSAVATLLLAEQEQLRLLKRTPAYTAAMRGEPVAKDAPTPAMYRDAFVQVSRCIEQSQTALMAQRMNPHETEWLLNQKKRQEMLAALDETCFEMCDISERLTGRAAPVREAVVESLDTLLLTAISGMAQGDASELDVLDAMAGNRGPAMERMRNRHLALSEHLSPEQRSHVLQISNLYERAAWSLHRFSALLRASPSFGTTPHAPDAARSAADSDAAFTPAVAE